MGNQQVIGDPGRRVHREVAFSVRSGRIAFRKQTFADLGNKGDISAPFPERPWQMPPVFPFWIAEFMEARKFGSFGAHTSNSRNGQCCQSLRAGLRGNEVENRCEHKKGKERWLGKNMYGDP